MFAERMLLTMRVLAYGAMRGAYWHPNCDELASPQADESTVAFVDFGELREPKDVTGFFKLALRWCGSWTHRHPTKAASDVSPPLSVSLSQYKCCTGLPTITSIVTFTVQKLLRTPRTTLIRNLPSQCVKCRFRFTFLVFNVRDLDYLDRVKES